MLAVALAAAAALLAILAVHLAQGVSDGGLLAALRAMLGAGSAADQQIVQHLVLPRAALGLTAGAALGIAGVLFQTVTGNNLASPTTIGVNSGAYLAAVAGAVFLPGLMRANPLAISFGGALTAAGLVYLIAGGARVSPVRLVLAGVAVSMALAAMTAVLQIFYERETAGLFFWGSGTLVQRDWSGVTTALPRVLIGAAVGLALARSLDVLRLGEDVARGLGQRVQLVRSTALLIGIFLAASTTAVTGPIGFVGLAAPHLARLVGVRRHLLLMPAAAMLGGVLLLGADALARTLHGFLGEVPAGVVTALIGAPWLIWLARSAPDHAGAAAHQNDQTHDRHRWAGHRASIPLAGAGIGVAVMIALGLSLGDIALTWQQILAALSGQADDFAHHVVMQLRLPRVLVAALAGCALGISGVLFQGVIRNPLAAPETLGVSGGAALGAVIVLVLLPDASPWLLPIGAFSGALTAFVVTYGLAHRNGVEPARLALIGIAVAAFCLAMVRVLVVQSDTPLARVLVWLAGSAYGAGDQELFSLIILLLVLAPVSFAMAPALNVMALGDHAARGVGLPLDRARLSTLLLATTLAASAVAWVGTIGFLGLMAPHAARLIIGPRHHLLLPLAALLGAFLLTAADLIGRVALAPHQVPAGLITALIGSPYFLWLLSRRTRAGH